jgi:bifunctional NMN adenylyltransferase/nudix hydrolase
MKDFDYLVYIGRFQPFHNGHLALLKSALERTRHVIAVLGSARRARNIKNPFSDQERERMILATAAETIGPDVAHRLSVCPVRDYYDDTRWVSAVQEAVRLVAGRSAKIGVVGHLKDHSSYYLQAFPEWDLIEESNQTQHSATGVRELYFRSAGGPLPVELASIVPPAVLRFLESFRATPEYADLIDEFGHVVSGERAWAGAPYPPVFATVDAVLRARDHVLLIKRGASPGKGQWALPGGFIEPRQRLLEGAVRELQEETRIDLPPALLRQSLAGREVFDHPDRSVRGRTITHAFFFDLGTQAPPAVAAADDAAQASWMPICELLTNETMIFEDHLHIIDRFLGVLPGPNVAQDPSASETPLLAN